MKPIIKVTPQQFLRNYHALTNPMIDCRVVVYAPPTRRWDPPLPPIKKPPLKPKFTNVKQRVFA